MKQAWMVVVVALGLGGCGMTSNIKMENGLLIQEAGRRISFDRRSR